MKKQFVKKIEIEHPGQNVSFDHKLPTDFEKVVGVFLETSDDTQSQQDTMSLSCEDEPIINNYPDGDGVSSRILRYDQNAQFPLKDSVFTVDIAQGSNKHMKGVYQNHTTNTTEFKKYWVKFYYLSN